MPHGGECAFNGVGGPQVLPMLSREVVKRQQRLAVLRQATHRLVVLDGVGLDKGVESGVGVVLRLGHPDVLQSALGLRLLALRQPIESTLAVLCTQQRCPRVLGHTSSIACQKPSAPSAIASSGPITSPRRFRSSSSPFQDCAFSRTPSVRPTSSLLPSGVAPMITSRHCALFSSRACTWMPSAQK